jgi:hypothetical protein
MPDDPVSFQGAIEGLSQNLEALRDFAEFFRSFLESQSMETVQKDEFDVDAIIAALHLAGIRPEPGMQTIPEEEIEKLVSAMSSKYQIKVSEPNERGIREITFGVLPSQSTWDSMVALSRQHTRQRMLYASVLMNLTSVVELFFSRLFHIHFARHPGAIDTKDKIFSFGDLADFETIDDARQHHIRTKIENLLRGPFDDWIAYLRSNLKLPLKYLTDDQPVLSEAFQRRNAIVHNGGLANSIYLAKVPEPVRPGIAVGDDLTPDVEYLDGRVDAFERSCVLIGSEMWKKNEPKCKERADLLNDLAYEHLRAERYEVTKALSTFVVGDNQASEEHRTTGLLNLWLCHKRVGNWSDKKKEAETADFSAKRLGFQLALAALLEDGDLFYSLLPRALQAGEITVEDICEFPIMEEMRKDPRFSDWVEEDVSERQGPVALEMQVPEGGNSAPDDESDHP